MVAQASKYELAQERFCTEMKLDKNNARDLFGGAKITKTTGRGYGHEIEVRLPRKMEADEAGRFEKAIRLVFNYDRHHDSTTSRYPLNGVKIQEVNLTGEVAARIIIKYKLNDYLRPGTDKVQGFFDSFRDAASLDKAYNAPARAA